MRIMSRHRRCKFLNYSLIITATICMDGKASKMERARRPAKLLNVKLSGNKACRYQFYRFFLLLDIGRLYSLLKG